MSSSLVSIMEHGPGVWGPVALRTGLLAAFCGPGEERPDLSLQELAILLVIEGASRPWSVQEVGKRLGMTLAALRKGTAALQRAGLVALEPGEGPARDPRILATPEGRRLVRELAASPPGGTSPQ